jgi:enolase
MMSLRQILPIIVGKANTGPDAALGGENGFASNPKSNEEAFRVTMKTIEEALYKPGAEIIICFEAAAGSSFERSGTSTRKP